MKHGTQRSVATMLLECMLTVSLFFQLYFSVLAHLFVYSGLLSIGGISVLEESDTSVDEQALNELSDFVSSRLDTLAINSAIWGVVTLVLIGFTAFYAKKRKAPIKTAYIATGLIAILALAVTIFAQVIASNIVNA